MIGKVSRGSDTAGLLRYLFGPGRANEHTDCHLVAAWDDTLTASYTGTSRAELRDLAQLLDQPVTALARPPAKTVWHCSIRTAPGDRHLSDAEWAEAACEVLDNIGLARRGDEGACRWVAVRHARDHIHLAVTLARQDGRPARAAHDYARVGAACRTLEARHGLVATAVPDRTAPRRSSRAEVEKARRRGLTETPRLQLAREVRRAALVSDDLDSFLQRLTDRGVQVRLRYSQSDPTVITGYAVATPTDRTAAGDPVWYGGGKLARQLSWPRLQAGWSDPHRADAAPQLHPMSHPTRRAPAVGRLLREAAAAARHVEHGEPAAAVVSAAVTLARLSASSRRR